MCKWLSIPHTCLLLILFSDWKWITSKIHLMSFHTVSTNSSSLIWYGSTQGYRKWHLLKMLCMRNGSHTLMAVKLTSLPFGDMAPVCIHVCMNEYMHACARVSPTYIGKGWKHRRREKRKTGASPAKSVITIVLHWVTDISLLESEPVIC